MISVRHAGLVPLVALLASLTGCRAVEGIFKAGVWVGVIAVLFVAGLVVLAAKVFGGSRA